MSAISIVHSAPPEAGFNFTDLSQVALKIKAASSAVRLWLLCLDKNYDSSRAQVTMGSVNRVISDAQEGSDAIHDLGSQVSFALMSAANMADMVDMALWNAEAGEGDEPKLVDLKLVAELVLTMLDDALEPVVGSASALAGATVSAADLHKEAGHPSTAPTH